MSALVRVRGAIYETREAALSDGWPDAEYVPGSSECWTHPNGKQVAEKGEWIALDYREPEEK